MNTAYLRDHKVLSAAAGILVLGSAAWGVKSLATGQKTTLPEELSAEALKAESEDPGKMMQRVHEAMNRNDLTEEQRRELWKNVHNVMETHMNQRLDEYFTAQKSQRQAILDRHLDQMRSQMQNWRQRQGQRGQDAQQRGGDGRPQRGASTGGAPQAARQNSGGADARQAGPGGGHFDGRRGDHSGPPTREQRKQHSESHNPDQMARRMAYFTALQKRAQERGIQMPFGPHGPGGPGGNH